MPPVIAMERVEEEEELVGFHLDKDTMLWLVGSGLLISVLSTTFGQNVVKHFWMENGILWIVALVSLGVIGYSLNGINDLLLDGLEQRNADKQRIATLEKEKEEWEREKEEWEKEKEEFMEKLEKKEWEQMQERKNIKEKWEKEKKTLEKEKKTLENEKEYLENKNEELEIEKDYLENQKEELEEEIRTMICTDIFEKHGIKLEKI